MKKLIKSLNLFIVCVPQNEHIDDTCTSSENVAVNTTYSEDIEYQSYIEIKENNEYQQLQNIIENFITKGKRCNFQNKISPKIAKEIFSKPTENLSLRNHDVDMFASIRSEDDIVPILNTQSSSSSSQFDSNKSEEICTNKEEIVKEPDLNRTSTFHTEKFVNVEENLAEKKTDEYFNQTVANENTLSTFELPANETVSGVLSSISSPQEDIPSFREWTEKHLAKEEKERGDDNNTNIPTNGKGSIIRNKNYASLDCGAKILATNAEARSAGSLLSSSRDEYLLSPCNSKIWFIVELCESVQLIKIELANFELFSSSPQEFSILISDRFPSRDWRLIGQFVAKDEKSIQSFDLKHDHFTKYVKVEFHSHYGKEHFCPVSLFRVYGTTEFEVLETADGGSEELENDGTENDDVNEPIISDQEDKKKKVETTNYLFGSARDVVINIVKKAAEALVIAPQQNENSLNSTNVTAYVDRISFRIARKCVTPRYMVLCPQCKEEFFHRLYKLISCYMKDLYHMSQNELIWKPLIKYNVCQLFGISSFYFRDYPPALFDNSGINDLYAVRLLQDEVLAALCNLLAIAENKAKQNVTYYEMIKKFDNNSVIESFHHTAFSIPDKTTTTVALNPQTASFKIVESTLSSDYPYDTQTLSSQIKPTKTLTVDSEMPVLVSFDPTHATNTNDMLNGADMAENEVSKTTNNEDNDVSKDADPNSEISDDTMSLDSLISEFEKSEQSSSSTQTSVPKPVLQKESVFLRLTNRIKALERNMSLSGQYLEELSRRYKKQVEEMQRILSESAEDRQKSIERDAKRSQKIKILAHHIAELRVAVDVLTAERYSWSYKALMIGEHSLIIFLEIVIFIVIVCLCSGIPNVEISKRKFSLEWRRNKPSLNGNNAVVSIPRRQSFDDLNSNKLRTHKRRPSEEALKIGGSTHQDLLIYETNRTSKSESRRKRKKRRELLLKSTTNAINLETGATIIKKKTNFNQLSNAPLSRSASASEIDEHSWGRHDHRINNVDAKVVSVELNENAYPPFFRTATSTRHKRLSNQFNGKSVLSPVFDVSSDQDSSVPTTPVKEKKINGIKRIVKKFF